ncbi:MAG: hypothetical protein AAF371_02915 [Pseudomonadota bacterium]
MRVIAWAAVIGALVLSLLWPLLLGRLPLYFYDTAVYLFGGGSALYVLGIETPYVEGHRVAGAIEATGATTETAPAGTAAVPQAAPGGEDAVGRGDSAEEGYSVSLARSPYYGAFLAIAGWMHNLFLAAYAQVALVLVTGFFLLRAVFGERLMMPAAILIPLGVVTPLAMFTVLLLPDIFAGLGILALVIPFVFAARLGWVDRVFWFALLVGAVLVHNTHLALALLLVLPLAFLAGVVLRRPWVPGLVSGGGAVALGFLSLFAFQQAVQAVYGYKPLSLPMVAATVLLEEPGRTYLEETCPENGLIFCDFRDARPTYVDQWLWAPKDFEGVYSWQDVDTKREMSRQQWSLLLNVLQHDPLGQLQASLGRFFWQLTEVSIRYVRVDDEVAEALESRLPPRDLEPFRASAHYDRTFPIRTLAYGYEVLSLIAAIAGAGLLIWLGRIVRRREGAAGGLPSAGEMLAFGTALAAGVVVNAAIMGVFSQVQGRYEARVIWLIGLFVLLTVAWQVRRRADQ